MPTLLVTGASGHLGRRAVELLLEANAGQVIAATRTPPKLNDLAERGAIIRQADFDDPASLAIAFAGVDRLLLVSTNAVAVPGQRITQHRNAVQAAQDAGVSHIVYTSIMNPTPDFPAFVNPDHRATEEALAASTMGWTVLRESIYTEMLLGSVSQALQLGGQLFSAAGDGKTTYITRDDCTRAAVAALTDDFTGRRTLDITGPEALSQFDIANIASQVTGQQITYIPIDLETLVQGMIGAGLPQPMAEGYATFDIAIAQGQFTQVSSAFEELTGRKPTSVADFLNANRDAFRPKPAASVS